MNNNTRSIRAGAAGFADEARNLTDQAMESTKELAGRAGEKLRDLRYGAKDLASRGASGVGEYAQATTRYVSDQPIKSALIAAAIGAALAGLVIALRRSNTKRHY